MGRRVVMAGMHPHQQRYALERGYSPGNGMTPMLLSRDPIATEGEASPGPDDVNPYDEREYEEWKQAQQPQGSPTGGDDPFVFDDVGNDLDAVVPEQFELPDVDVPEFEF